MTIYETFLNHLNEPGFFLLISGLDLSVFIALAISILRHFKDLENRFHEHEKKRELLKVELERQLTDHMLAISNEYARLSVVQEIERRVVSHLLRIESKLDVTALKAEAAHQKIRP